MIDQLKSAIRARKPIRFEYIESNKVRSVRVGNPHAVFAHESTANVLAHIVQTGGASKSGGLPRFGTFKLEFLASVEVLDNEPCFMPDAKYNPLSEMYVNVIAKV